MSDPNVIKPRKAPLSGKPPSDSTSYSEAEHSPTASNFEPSTAGSAPDNTAKTDNTKPRLFLGIAAALGAAALYAVFVVIPGTLSPTPSTPSDDAAAAELETANTATAAAAPPETAQPVSPFRDAQLARAKELAEKELAAFVELQIELEDNLQIGAWGQSRYDAVKDLATQGDTQFQTREFEEALATYREATLELDKLRSSGEDEFAAGIDAGNAALADFNQLLAIREFERAQTIKPNDAAALAGLKRAEKLPEIQSLLRKARQLARRGDTQEATKTYQQILAIDPQTATVDEALGELSQAATQADYQDHLSTGFAALETGRYVAARKAFNAALTIKPNDSVARGGLQQIALETEVQSLQNLQNTARTAVSEERWDDAVNAFDKALEKDKNLAFAQGGRRDAVERRRLAKGMDIIVSQAQKLSDNTRMQQAVSLLQTAKALPSAGPRWDTAIQKAEQTVKSYQQPVAVRLTSNNATQVTVYKVGRIGTFTTHDLELRPGAYTIVGSADGCQDVRKEVVVTPKMPPVEIVCEKRL